jgi:hypothetical protein
MQTNFFDWINMETGWHVTTEVPGRHHVKDVGKFTRLRKGQGNIIMKKTRLNARRR